MIGLIPMFKSWRNLLNKLAYALIVYLDQSVHQRSLSRVLDGRSMDSQGSNLSSCGKLKL